MEKTRKRFQELRQRVNERTTELLSANRRLEKEIDDRNRGFELALPPLMRLTFIELGSEDHWLVWTSHHAIADGCGKVMFEFTQIGGLGPGNPAGISPTM